MLFLLASQNHGQKPQLSHKLTPRRKSYNENIEMTSTIQDDNNKNKSNNSNKNNMKAQTIMLPSR